GVLPSGRCTSSPASVGWFARCMWFSLAPAKPDGRFSSWLSISPLFSILCFPIQVSIRFIFFLLLLICSINQLIQHLTSWFPPRFFTFILSSRTSFNMLSPHNTCLTQFFFLL